MVLANMRTPAPVIHTEIYTLNTACILLKEMKVNKGIEDDGRWFFISTGILLRSWVFLTPSSHCLLSTEESSSWFVPVKVVVVGHS
jgi:hypothetical protein